MHSFLGKQTYELEWSSILTTCSNGGDQIVDIISVQTYDRDNQNVGRRKSSLVPGHGKERTLRTRLVKVNDKRAAIQKLGFSKNSEFNAI